MIKRQLFSLSLSLKKKKKKKKKKPPKLNISYGDYSLKQHNTIEYLGCYLESNLNLFVANVPLMEKPGGWFLLAKCVKNTCGRVTF